MSGKKLFVGITHDFKKARGDDGDEFYKAILVEAANPREARIKAQRVADKHKLELTSPWNGELCVEVVDGRALPCTTNPFCSGKGSSLNLVPIGQC